jgi:ubiquinone/menaquinone biosynthesis C-methylase UbiE
MHWFEKWAVNSFSGIYLRWYLLVRGYPAAIREVRRVLKPGGRFFLQDLSRHFFLPGLRWLFPPESLFTRATLVWQLEAAGFRVEAARGQAIIFLRARRR